jgi:hypothetical protein
MCVIAVINDNKDRLTDDAVEAMYQANNDGAGFAWRERNQVFWKKGLNLEESQAMARDLPAPYVAHFRVASCGGVLPELTHPFSVLPSVPLKLEGHGNHQVLFHNGHWTDWKIETFRKVTQEAPIPGGPWSDTRAIAWLIANYGDRQAILDMIGEKTVLFGPHGYSLSGKGWVMYREEGRDWLVSNEFWTGRYNGLKNRALWIKKDEDKAKQTQGVVALPNQNPPRRSVAYYEALQRDGKLNKNGLKRLKRWFEWNEVCKAQQTAPPS